jgi:hypothetical protein
MENLITLILQTKIIPYKQLFKAKEKRENTLTDVYNTPE